MWVSVWDSITLWYIILDDQDMPWPLTQTETLEPRMVSGALKTLNSWKKEVSFPDKEPVLPLFIMDYNTKGTVHSNKYGKYTGKSCWLFCNDASLNKTWKLFFTCLLENTLNYSPFWSSFLIVVYSSGTEKNALVCISGGGILRKIK